jgi:hypothetical protein
MQAVQLKMSQSAATGAPSGLTKQDIEDAIRSATKHEQTSSTINVAVDEKLDMIVAQQHEMLQQEKKLLEGQGQADVKLDALVHILEEMDPSAAANTLEFTISGTMGQHIGSQAIDGCQGITTHAGIISPWMVVSEQLDKGGVLSQTEWDWIGKFVGDAINFDHGKVPVMQVMQIMPVIVQTLTPLLHAKVDNAKAILKLEERGVGLKMKSVDMPLNAASVVFELKWPALGAKVKHCDVQGVTLPAVAKSMVKQPTMPGMPEKVPSPDGCCIIF